jgi:predicted nucleotidyltransferase
VIDTVPPREALARLVRATEDGTLDALCDALGVRVLGAFGSVVRDDPDPDDLDVGVGFDGPPHELELIDALARLTGSDRIDLAVLDGASPVLRAEALVGIPLYERTAGRFAIEQMAALAERRDTEHLRRLDLALMAERGA